MNGLNIIHSIFCRIEKDFRHFAGMIFQVGIRILYKICIDRCTFCFRSQYFKVYCGISEIFPVRNQVLFGKQDIADHQRITACRFGFQHILFIIGRIGYRTKDFLVT